MDPRKVYAFYGLSQARVGVIDQPELEQGPRVEKNGEHGERAPGTLEQCPRNAQAKKQRMILSFIVAFA